MLRFQCPTRPLLRISALGSWKAPLATPNEEGAVKGSQRLGQSGVLMG